jgi:hypothetical protein
MAIILPHQMLTVRLSARTPQQLYWPLPYCGDIELMLLYLAGVGISPCSDRLCAPLKKQWTV